MPKLFGRDWKLTIDTLDISALEFSFVVTKNTKAEPNKLDLHLFNLSPDHIAQVTKRAQLKQATGVQVSLSAGYLDDVPLIFKGDAREIYTTHEQADRITTIGAHDGGRAWREARMLQNFGPNAPVSSVIKACASAMGIGIGNANDVGSTVKSAIFGSTFPNGIVLAGKAADQLARVCKIAGVTYSIQNGVLQLLAGDQPLQSQALRIAADSGMVGSPTIDMDSSNPTNSTKIKKPTLLSVKTLLIPGLAPGRKVVMDSADFKGTYQITEAKYIGDTSGNDWNAHLKLRPIT